MLELAEKELGVKGLTLELSLRKCDFIQKKTFLYRDVERKTIVYIYKTPKRNTITAALSIHRALSIR